MEFIKRYCADAADLGIHERDIFVININHDGIVSACGRVEYGIPVYDYGQFFLDYEIAQVVIGAFRMFDFGVESVGAQSFDHALVGGASGAGGASDFPEFLLRFADAEVTQNHLEAGGAAISVLVGDGAEFDHERRLNMLHL